MKILFSLFTSIVILFSCTNSPDLKTIKKEKEVPEKQSFFPVTSYIKGELYNFKKDGVNPLKYTTIKNHTDSVWLKIEEIDEAVQEFLHPEIDSVNLISLFTEKSFLDQSIGTFTFTYDASGPLPDTMTLKHWDVYIDPASGKVKRVYMIKEISKNKMLQLTWLSRKWCKVTTIVTDQNGASSVEKEEKVTWDF
ncbi:MAG: hypothetical protein ABI666_07655 [Ferruginibacter sp.]